MKRLTLVLAVAIVLMAGISARAEPKAAQGIRDHCAAEWPTDYSMQKYCIDTQRAAYNEVAVLYKSFDPEEKNIANRCLLDWGYVSGFDDPIDWSMVAYCTKEQLKAYRQLKGK